MRDAPFPRRLPQPLGDRVHHRQIEERFAAEEREHQLLRAHTIELALDPIADAARRFQRHPIGALVVVGVIALEAVVAGEVALQRRQNRDVQLRRVALHLGQILIERAPVGVAALDQESVLVQERKRFELVLVLPDHRVGRPIEQGGDVARHDELGVGERIHQEDFAPLIERHTKVEHRRLHHAPKYIPKRCCLAEMRTESCL